MKIKSLSQILLGSGVLLVGVGLLLDQFGVWEFASLLSTWWPILIIGVGLISLLSNPKTPLWPLFISGIGGLFLLQNLNVIEGVSIWSILLPLALIFVGLSILIERVTPKINAISEDESDLFVMFSGINSINKSDKYKGGRANVLFGGIELDLTQANIDKNAKLDIFVAFGGIELKVPKGWTVKTSGLPLFGGWEDKTAKPSSNKAPVLEIHGTCLFGGVEIKN